MSNTAEEKFEEWVNSEYEDYVPNWDYTYSDLKRAFLAGRRQRLTTAKEKVENHLFFADFGDEKIEEGYDKGIKKHREYVLTLIEEELQ